MFAIVSLRIIWLVTEPVSPVVTTVPATSGSVRVRLAVRVAGVKVTPKVLVPPARPVRITESWVAAARAVKEPPTAVIAPADVEIAPVVANDVPVAAPMFGVTKVGVLERTLLPVPVMLVKP